MMIVFDFGYLLSIESFCCLVSKGMNHAWSVKLKVTSISWIDTFPIPQLQDTLNSITCSIIGAVTRNFYSSVQVPEYSVSLL